MPVEDVSLIVWFELRAEVVSHDLPSTMDQTPNSLARAVHLPRAIHLR